MNARRINCLGISLAIVFLAGCSDRPSAGEIGRALEAKIQTQGKGRIKLLSVEKTDGTLQEFLGQKRYVIKYDAEIEFLDDCYWGPRVFGLSGGTSWSGEFYTDCGEPDQYGTVKLMFPVNIKETNRATKGQRVKVSGDIILLKTDNGWH